MKKSNLAPGNYRVSVNVIAENGCVRVKDGTVHGLEEWREWEDGELSQDTSIMLGGVLSYTAEHIAEVISRPADGRYGDDLVPYLYAGLMESKCASLEAAVGVALYDMLQVHEIADGESFLENGDMFVLEPPAGQGLVTERCYFIVAGGVHVADTRDVRPGHLRELLGDRHLPASAMGTRWLERRSEQAL